MNKLDEFKEFIKDKDYLINKVHNKEVSWQTLYETFDLCIACYCDSFVWLQ